MKSIYIEKWAPYFVAIIGVAAWHYAKLTFPEGEGILSSSLTLGAILAGFLATTKAILMSLRSPVMQDLRESGYIDDLASYLAQAIWVSFAFCVVAIIGFFGTPRFAWYGYLWIFLGLTSAGTFVRVTLIMIKVIRR